MTNQEFLDKMDRICLRGIDFLTNEGDYYSFEELPEAMATYLCNWYNLWGHGAKMYPVWLIPIVQDICKNYKGKPIIPL